MNRLKPARRLALFAAAAAAAVGCGRPSASNGAPHDERVQVELSARDMRFDRDVITVPAGARVVVRFTNNDAVAHNFAVYPETSDEPIFSGRLVSGPSGVIAYQFTAPERPGEYRFICEPHPFMNGRFIAE